MIYKWDTHELPVEFLLVIPNSDLNLYNAAGRNLTMETMLEAKRQDRQYIAIKTGFQYDGQEENCSIFCPESGPIFTDGNHRLAAAVELGWETLHVSWSGIFDFHQWVDRESKSAGLANNRPHLVGLLQAIN